MDSQEPHAITACSLLVPSSHPLLCAHGLLRPSVAMSSPARRLALAALVAAEQRAGKLRAELREAEAEVQVLARKLKKRVSQDWEHLPESPDGADSADAAAADPVAAEAAEGPAAEVEGGPPAAAVVPGPIAEAGPAAAAEPGPQAGVAAGVAAGDVVEPAAAGPVEAAGAAAGAVGAGAAAPLVAGALAAEQAAGAGAAGAAGGTGGGDAGGEDAGQRRRQKRFREMDWPESWVKKEYVKGVRRPAGACLGCWWLFQEYEGWRKHEAGGNCLLGD